MDPQRDEPTVVITETRVRGVIDVILGELVAVGVGLVAHAVSNGGGGGDEDPS